MSKKTTADQAVVFSLLVFADEEGVLLPSLLDFDPFELSESLL